MSSKFPTGYLLYLIEEAFSSTLVISIVIERGIIITLTTVMLRSLVVDICGIRVWLSRASQVRG